MGTQLRDRSYKPSYYEKHKEQISQYGKDYYHRNKEKVLAKCAEWAKNNPEKIKAVTANQRKKHPINNLLYKARRRAEEKGLEFSIKKEDLYPLPTHCPVLGIELTYGGTRVRVGSSASIDRLDNNLGYTKENARIISSRANTLKNDGLVEEFEKIISYMKGLN